MSNKIISLGNTKKAQLSSLELYRDIDTIAADNPGKRPVYRGYWFDLRSSDDVAVDGIITEECNKTVDPENIRLLAANETEFKIDMSEFELKKFAVSRLANVKAIQNSIHNIFTWIPGERILNPEFGSNIRRLLYNGITPLTSEAIVAEILHSVLIWEPRVKIEKVINISNINDTENNTIHLRIIYTIPSLSEELFWYDYVYNNESNI